LPVGQNDYQTAQRFSGGLTISAPALQENARWKRCVASDLTVEG
jgi:hypothetical protein